MNKKKKVLIAKKIPDYVEKYIGEYCEYEIVEENSINYNTIFKKIYDKEGLLLSSIKIDKNLLEHAPNLKVVSNVSVGYNNFDINAMKEKKIIGTITPDVLNNTVADLIFGLILAVARRIPESDLFVKSGKWNSVNNDINNFGKDVHHSTLGIIGMGRIGQTVAKRAILGFDMKVLYHNRNRKFEAEKTLGVKYVNFKDLLQNSDFILIMTPLSDETYHLIDEREFSIMKKNAIFINASRGSTVNEQALIKALQEKRILGAGLDVYEKEPIDKDNPLLRMPNVVTLPHIGSATEKTRSDMCMLAAQNMVKALYYECPTNVVPELIDIDFPKCQHAVTHI